MLKSTSNAAEHRAGRLNGSLTSLQQAIMSAWLLQMYSSYDDDVTAAARQCVRPVSVLIEHFDSTPHAVHPADGHRFPMPKDHMLYLALQAEGLAQLTFTPTYPGEHK
jgi:hypothetical protein